MKMKRSQKMNKNEKKKVMKKTNQMGQGLPIDEVIKKIPSEVKLNAKALLLLIKDKRLFTWTNEGEIIVNSKCLKETNIKNLIFHAVTNAKDKPKGYKYFYRILKKEKIPNFLLRNNLCKYTKRGKSVMWHPPGELNK